MMAITRSGMTLIPGKFIWEIKGETMRKIIFTIITMLAITHGAKADPTPQSQPVDLSKATQDVVANDDGTV